MVISNTTKMALQTALAILIAEIVTQVFYIERGYWIILSAMVLTTQTWGESLKRSLERVSMTILGGICGTALYFMLPSNQYIIVSLLLLYVFFAVYLLPIYHMAGVFALTGFVVFLFAMVGGWNFVLLGERIVDTALGALIAILVGCFFLPVKTDISELFAGHFEKMLAALQLAFDGKLHTNQIAASQRLFSDFQMIRKNAMAISYEILFHRMNRRDFYFLITQTAFCTQYVVGLIDAYSWLAPYLTKDDHEGIMTALNTTRHNLECLNMRLRNQPAPPMLPAVNLTELLTKAIHADPNRFAALDTEVLGFYNIIYFFTRLNTRINDIYFLLGKVNYR